MILWLSWFGVRKRNYSSTAGMLQGWLSAHVYFGTALIVIATLHMAFKVGWNVHTLAYVLMLIVIFSGFYGVYAYLRFPRVMTDNLGDDTLQMLLIRIADLDRQSRQLALSLKKQELVARARRDVQLKAWLDVWLYIHVPLSIALLVTLTIHIVSVFFY